MSRVRIGVVVSAVVLVVLGLTGGSAAGGTAAPAMAAPASPASPVSPASTATGGDPADQLATMGKHVLHGEGVVYTDQGAMTVAVQRGSVTAITDTSVTVQSADGFTQSWTFGGSTHILEHRTSVQPSGVTVGTDVGVAGVKSSDHYTAYLMVLSTS
jgi:hypothetical protein